MNQFNTGVVVTTIHDTDALDGYLANFKKYERLGHVKVFVIADRKTPQSLYARCERLRRAGLDLTVPTLEEQEAFLNRVGFPSHMVPYDSDNRRNVGFLMALDANCEMLVSIDDDNYCMEDEDFVGAHETVCMGAQPAQVVTTSTGWFNVLEQLELCPDTIAYPRGFPYYRRHLQAKEKKLERSVSVHMNAGLWLEAPDIDGMSWLVNPVKVSSFRGESYVLDDDTWAPVNSQNTAMKREVVACYYYLKMNYPLAGMPIDRLGDIYSGYFSQACVKSMGASVRFGTPIARHLRNSHNHMNDAASEWGGIVVLEDLLCWLTDGVEVSGKTYPQKYQNLAEQLAERVETFDGKVWNDSARAYFHQMSFYMKRWASVCQRLL